MTHRRSWVLAEAMRTALAGMALGSAIPSLAEASASVAVIERDELLRSGAASVADYLHASPFNSFGSFRPQSSSTAQSWAELSLRGLGGRRTLILIDWRRAPIAPNVGFAQDLNAIPIAAVERIEINAGVTATYGADAVGGVVNIVTRRGLRGVEVSVGASSPTREGGETEDGSVLFGSSGDRGSLVAGASYANRGIVFERDRDWRVPGASTFSNNFINATPAPGTLFAFAPSGFRANPTFGSVVPGGCTGPGFSISGTGASARCVYDFTTDAADDVELRQSALFVRADHLINDDWSAWLNARVGRVESFGRVAPSPSSPWPGGGPFIPVGSPNHPSVRFPNQGYDPTRPVFLRHRFAAIGSRDTTTDGDDYDIDSGFRGRIGAVEVAVGARLMQSEYRELGRGYVVGALAQSLIASGVYDIYAPFANSQETLDSMTATINRDAGYRAEEVHAQAKIELFEMRGGAAEVSISTEFRTESLDDRFDTLQTSSAQLAGASLANTAASRDIGALRVDAHLPVFERFDVDLSTHHDQYSDVGGDTSGQLGLSFRPTEELALQASLGRGFSAPPLALQGIEPVTVVDTYVDRVVCQSFIPCSYQILAYIISNPNLRSEHSRQASIGLDWAASRWLQLSVSYFDTRIDDRIQAISSESIIRCLLGTQTNCPTGLSELPPGSTSASPHLGLGVARAPISGELLYTQRGYANFGSIEVSGADLALQTQFEFGKLGNLGNRLLLSWLRTHETDGVNVVDSPSHPRQRAMLSSDWTVGDFDFAWNIHYIHGTQSTADTFDDSQYPARLPSWTTHDLQASWNAPWKAVVTLGVNNLADKDPVLDPYDPTGRGYDFALYDGYGRVPYFRYRQRF